MKTEKKILIPLLSCLCVGMLMVSCHKVPSPGTGILFRASARGTSGSPTKTSYGDIEGNTQSYQMLNWVEGDMIRLYSPQAVKIYTESDHFADYLVSSVTTDGTTSVAQMLSADDEGTTNGNGLGWAEGTNYFYAVYPSPWNKANISMAAGAGNAVSVTGTIPASQTLTWTTSGNNVIGSPDMGYAYMYASTSAQPTDEGVNLNFSPAFTAFQFEVGPGENASVRLTEFSLSTSDAAKPLAGSFIVSGAQGSETTVCSGAASSPTSLTVSMDQTITTGHTCIITVFALPQDLAKLSISYTGDEIGTRTLDLKQDSAWLSFVGCKKYRIYGLSFPKTEGLIATGEGINWDGSVQVSTGGELIAWSSTTQVSTGGEDIGSWISNPELSGTSGEGITHWVTE